MQKLISIRIGDAYSCMFTYKDILSIHLYPIFNVSILQKQVLFSRDLILLIKYVGEKLQRVCGGTQAFARLLSSFPIGLIPFICYEISVK